MKIICHLSLSCFENNGQTTCCMNAKCIKHPDNPCYDKSYAEENTLNDIQISTVAPYVGKENAPAASALLYNIVGRGQSFNNLLKFTQEIFKYLKLK